MYGDRVGQPQVVGTPVTCSRTFRPSSTCHTATPFGIGICGNVGTYVLNMWTRQVISTDDVRRELRESGAMTGGPGVLDAGLYTPDNVATVYEVALRRAHVLLGMGNQ